MAQAALRRAALGAALASAIVSAAAAPLSRALLRGVADDAFATQLSFYSFATGEFGDIKVNDPFWTSANALANCATFAQLTGDAARAEAVLSNSFTVLVPAYATPKRGNDDIQWHAHAWLRAYELTGNATYLEEVFKIYNLLLDPASPWHGWNSTCGALNWWSNVYYVNTITNGLAFTGMLRLQRITGSTTPIFGRTLQQWATAIWAWAQQPGLFVNGAFIDGFGSDCKTAGGAPWTYNSGIWLDGLTSLSLLTRDPSFSSRAFEIAQSSAAAFSRPAAGDFIMREVSCGNVDGDCGGADGREFKGVWARHLGYALRDWAAPAGSTAAANPAAAAWARSWLANTTASILARDASTLPAPPATVLFGQRWQGPFASDNTPWISHSAAFDVILASLAAL